MNVYNRGSLISFYQRHSDCKDTLEKWYHDVSSKIWEKPGDITRDFNMARTVGSNRAIFKINENDYRLIVEANFTKGWVFVKFIGTHKAYDKIDAEKVDHFRPKKKSKP
jgi:mRNA interferase HigB